MRWFNVRVMPTTFPFARMRTRMVNKQRGTTLQAYRQHQLSKVQNYTHLMMSKVRDFTAIQETQNPYTYDKNQ